MTPNYSKLIIKVKQFFLHFHIFSKVVLFCFERCSAVLELL